MLSATAIKLLKDLRSGLMILETGRVVLSKNSFSGHHILGLQAIQARTFFLQQLVQVFTSIFMWRTGDCPPTPFALASSGDLNAYLKPERLLGGVFSSMSFCMA